MVASVSVLTSSAQASSYYEADDYYAEGGLSPSEWQGKGAEELGLSGDVDRERFRELLDGQVGDQQLGTFRDGQLEHRSEEHTSELQSLMRISYAVFCLNKKTIHVSK